MRVDIWSDVVCPWCYIGKRRFESALAQFEHSDEVEVVWRSFELDPSAPPSPEQPGGHANDLAKKFGTDVASIHAMFDRVTSIAAAEGLDYHFELSRAGNTFDAHRLLHLAKQAGVQDELKEALDDATFTKGLAVSDHSELAQIAQQVGLDADRVQEVLSSDEFAAEVRADERQAQEYGITGVPFFVFDQRLGVSGAQETEHLLAALQQAWGEAPSLTMVSPDADPDSCDIEDPNC